MLKIRLQRRGKKNYATYRVVVAEHTAPIKGRFIDDVGSYNPHTNEFKVAGDAVSEWLAKGAKASPTVHNLLIEHKVVKGEKVTAWRPKKKEVEEGAAEAPKEEPAEAPAEKPAEAEKSE